MIERLDQTSFDRQNFLRHLDVASRLLGNSFAEPAARMVLEVFDEEFKTHVVQLKAASKPGTGLYYRVFYNGPSDLTSRAQAAGMLPAGHSASTMLESEILASLPGATRAGLDFDATADRPRVAKIWTFTGGPVPARRLADLRSLPASVQAHAGFFRRHGLRDFYFVASDFQQRTMNIYFGWEPEQRTEEWIQKMATETGGQPLPQPLCRQIISNMAVSAGVGTTFSWDRPELLRWCLYGLNIPYGSAVSGLPTLPPRLDRLRSEGPTLNDCPQYNVGWSFGRVGYYMKLEKNYARDANFLHTVVMGGNFSHSPSLTGNESERVLVSTR
jgi:hypothetical protein